MDVRDGAIRVRAAAVRLPGPVLSGLRTMAAGAALAWFATAGSLHQFIGWIGALLFGAATLLRLDRDGVPDLRLRIISPASASAMSRRCRPSAPALRRYGMVMLIAPVGLAALCAAPLGAEEFRSPSGNITCMFSSPSNPETALPGRENMREYREYDVRCDMFDYTPSWSTPPDDCDLDWGLAGGVRNRPRHPQLLRRYHPEPRRAGAGLWPRDQRAGPDLPVGTRGRHLHQPAGARVLHLAPAAADFLARPAPLSRLFNIGPACYAPPTFPRGPGSRLF